MGRPEQVAAQHLDRVQRRPHLGPRCVHSFLQMAQHLVQQGQQEQQLEHQQEFPTLPVDVQQLQLGPKRAPSWSGPLRERALRGLALQGLALQGWALRGWALRGWDLWGSALRDQARLLRQQLLRYRRW